MTTIKDAHGAGSGVPENDEARALRAAGFRDQANTSSSNCARGAPAAQPVAPACNWCGRPCAASAIGGIYIFPGIAVAKRRGERTRYGCLRICKRCWKPAFERKYPADPMRGKR